jgi:UDP:flavonoid glycosyltransferase YjiC (YdhE family)
VPITTVTLFSNVVAHRQPLKTSIGVMPYHFLVASWAAPGDLCPMLTGARQLRDKGHDIRFIARSDAREQVEAAQFRFAAWRRMPNFSPVGNAADGNPMRYAYDNVLFGPAAARAADTRDEFDSAPTDALLAHDCLFGCAMAAEAAGIPCALLSPHISVRPLPGMPPLGSGMRAPRTPEERAEVEAASSRYAAVMNEWLPKLNEARASQGLAPLDDVMELYDRPARLLLAVSAAFDFPADYLPSNVRYIGPLLDKSAWSKSWVAPWRHGPDRPRALISFSTTFKDQADALQRAVNAAAGIDMETVATVGALKGETFQASKNVTLLPSAPHDVVMKEVSLVVTHGGHGTVSRALFHGLPLLVMARGPETNDNAARVEAHGAGLALPSTASEKEIAAALNRLIREPHFRIAARRLGHMIADEVRSARLVGEMEEIAEASRASGEGDNSRSRPFDVRGSERQ